MDIHSVVFLRYYCALERGGGGGIINVRSYNAVWRKVDGTKRTRQSRKALWVVLNSRLLGFSISAKSEKKARDAMDVCLQVPKESNKSRFDSYSVRNSVLIISQISRNSFRQWQARGHLFSFRT